MRHAGCERAGGGIVGALAQGQRVAFCQLNDTVLNPTDVDEAEGLVVVVASGGLSDYTEIARRLRHLR